MPWTAQEISLLIGLWPTASAAQISKWLNRSRGSVCGKAMRLRSDGVLPAEEVKPVQTPHGPAKTTVTSIRPAKRTPPIDATVPPPDMRRCSLVELDDGQCRWPLGDMHQVVTLFCGGAAVSGFSFAGIICGWRDATEVCRNPIAVHIGLAEVPVGLPRVCCRLAEVSGTRGLRPARVSQTRRLIVL